MESIRNTQPTERWSRIALSRDGCDSARIYTWKQIRRTCPPDPIIVCLVSHNRPIPKDVMLPFAEDGIRVYTRGGSVSVDNCTVKKMRGGIRLYLSNSATVTNSKAVDCGNTNFNMPHRGKITGSFGNFAYGPLSDFQTFRNQDRILN